ncbi:alpha-amylase family glycosyl hydrolase [Yunchengibacter salinarum]|uniref:alpha-amylase family glycosyl hydrolase n=1 Tax=Yunchengibacter salinarum TaxID=3133399 RepID=UPI0035B5B7AD
MNDWWRGAVFYQIYPRSFMDSSGSGTGDLAGVTERLDHVADLGVDAIWLSPFFTSPMADFGYDVADYRDVDPLFGTLEDFDALLARAHGLGLKVIIDQVYSHTSDRHAWFQESRESRHNARADWYVWADPAPDGRPPNNWQSVFGGPAWTWDARRQQYYLHNFLAEQPDLNFHNPRVQEAMLDVARFWLERGVDGFRLDVANYYFHDKSLRDNPPAKTPPRLRPYDMQAHIHDRSRPETLGFLERLRALMDSYGDRMAVAEIGCDHPMERSMEYTSGPRRLHTAYNFTLLDAHKLTPRLIASAMAGWTDPAAWPSWSFSNHDVVRAPSRFGDARPPAGLPLLLNALLLSLRGTIFLYQGEELGLPQAHVPYERLVDPEGIRFWPHTLGRDGCRTPMPWRSALPHAGFSTHEDTWLPMDPHHPALAVDAQTDQPDSVLEQARALLRLRREAPALRQGSIKAEALDDALLLVTRRAGNAGTMTALFNLSDTATELFRDLGAATACFTVNGASLDRGGRAKLPPWSGLFVAG